MELTVPASPPRTADPRQVPSSAQVAVTVTNLVMQIRRTGASTSTGTSDLLDSQASGSTTRDLPLTRIPRVTTTESDPPQASSSSHA